MKKIIALNPRSFQPGNTCGKLINSFEFGKTHETEGISIVTVTNKSYNLLSVLESIKKQDTTKPIQWIICCDGIKEEDVAFQDFLHKCKELVTNADETSTGKEQSLKKLNLKIEIRLISAQKTRYVFEKLGALRNLGIRFSEQKHIAFWDDDNSWKHNHISSLTQKLLEDPSKNFSYSWREMVCASTKEPYIVEEGHYPWTEVSASQCPEGLKTFAAQDAYLYEQYKKEGILEAGSKIIRDKHGYGVDNSQTCVDTGEWLFLRQALVDKNVYFSEDISKLDTSKNTSDDRLFIERFMREYGVKTSVCSELPTLLYTFGNGISNSGKHVTDKTASDSMSLRFTYSSLRETQRQWALPKDFRNIIKSSPYASGLTSSELQLIEDRVKSVNWEAVQRTIEPKIRAHLCEHDVIKDDTPLSFIVFGSYFWKLEGKPNDMDIAVIIEDESYCGVKVGGNHIQTDELNKVLPPEWQLQESYLDISFAGRGAVYNPVLHGGDLTNLVVWSHIGGLCVSGNPFVKVLDNQNIFQDIFTTLGFASKGDINTPKYISTLIRCCRIAIYLCEKLDNEKQKDQFIELIEILNNFKTEMHKKICEASDARENKITILQFTEDIKDLIHELYSNTKCSQKNKEEEGCIAA